MSLSLLAPGALLLSGLIVLPVIAHLARQTPRDRRAFGAMLLLQRVVKKLRRRRRLRDLPLLLLRILSLVALAFAFAAPRLIYPGGAPEYGGSGRVVLVLDQSMSMLQTENGSTLLQRARIRALEVLDTLPEGTQIGVVVFEGQAIPRTAALTADQARVRGLLEELRPTQGVSNLRAGLHEARRLLGGEPGEVLIFTDEAGPGIVSGARTELESLVEAGSTIVPMPIRARAARNVAITSANYGDGIEGGQVTLKLSNFGAERVEVPCEVTLPDGAEIPIFADLPPEGAAEERLTVPPEALGGVGEAKCNDPDLAADDSRFFHLPRVGASRVLVVDGDPGDTPTRSEVYFLERALAPWGGRKSGVTLDVTAPSGLMGLDVKKHRVVFLANVADPRPFGPLLTEFVRKGGSVVISVGNNVAIERYNAALGGILPSLFREPQSIADREEQGISLQLPGLAHPLFGPFSSSGRAAIGKIRSHRILMLEPYEDRGDEITTLLRYEGGAPALIERRIGQGKVLLWTSTVDWSWSNFPLQAAFMPMMQRIVRYLGGDSGAGAQRFSGTVGQVLRIPLPDISMEPDVVGPTGELVRSRIEGSQLLFTPEEAGAYQLRLPDSPPLAWIAINTDPIESDVRHLESIAAVGQELDPEKFTQHKDFAFPLLVFSFLCFLVQGLLSARPRRVE